ncbi:hypothetical protein AA106555_0237 [Neokomagataea thailandica NBRC 106555]|uniref:Lipoprotein n=2 Tax=Neokomagataea TaxID=1223423 RepID=A0A4Y6V738_9PROT|nr:MULTISPECIES: hypothetical protein [Neokomagataea]QDH24145.1 hypothetical protein D5366_01440 [Neokomagataea tanensis]GBR50510.1 hypothetical protein AA106555_0237 [Neokomagataea thailandica NBRC 106555]
MPFLRRPTLSGTIMVATILALTTATVTLTGCEDESNPSLFAPACPRTDIPAGTADRFAYTGQDQDLRNLTSHVQITALSGDCTRGPDGPEKQKMVRTRVGLSFTIERGPATTQDKVTIPYFIAIMQNGKIVDKKTFNDTFSLTPNVSTQTAKTELRLIDLPASANLQENPYTLEVGLQLTRSELDYNRKHPRPSAFRSNSQ